MNLGKCTQGETPQSSLRTLPSLQKVPFCCFAVNPHPHTPGSRQPLTCFLLQRFGFNRISYQQNFTVCNFLYWDSFPQHDVFDIQMLLCAWVVGSFSLFSSILLCVYMHIHRNKVDQQIGGCQGIGKGEPGRYRVYFCGDGLRWC